MLMFFVPQSSQGLLSRDPCIRDGTTSGFVAASKDMSTHAACRLSSHTKTGPDERA